MGEGSTAAAIGTMTLGTILLIVAGVALIAGLLDYRLTTKAMPPEKGEPQHEPESVSDSH